MIFMAVLSSLSFAMLSMSSTNVQIADNQRQGNLAITNAQSGLEVLRYWIDDMGVSAKDLTAVKDALTLNLANASVTNMAVTADDPTNPTTLTISAVALDSQSSQTFSAVISQLDADTIQVDVTGTSGQLSRTIRTNFNFATRGSGVFDYGIAGNGPLLMTGQSEIDGVNLAVESDVYINAGITGNSFEISNQASVAGNVHIVDPYATVDIGSQATVGGESGEAALDHVILGADSVTFPTPDTGYFAQFATGDVINSESSLSGYDVLNNVTITANTNPTFSGNKTINGVLFIEQPNKVHFSGQVTIRGIIVGNSAVGDDSPDNNLKFTGQVQCLGMSELTGTEFDAIKNETGTFIIAPGFSADFSGQANVVNGVIAVGGARFTGQAGGTINGSIINYSTDPVVLSGQSSLSFNRSGRTNNPAGFAAAQVVEYNATSYSEVH
jgi:Tfp pilus assembly protein PilX